MWDESIVNNSAPSQFKPAVIAAAAQLSGMIVSNKTVSYNIGWGEVGGSPTTPGTPISPGSIASTEATAFNTTYSAVRTALIAAAKSANALQAVSTLPGSNPLPGAPGLLANYAQAIILGLTTAPGGAYSFCGFDSTTNWSWSGTPGAGQYDFNPVCLHEMTEALGRQLGCGVAGIWFPFDLYRYSASGTRQTGGVSASPSYFSIDSGATDLKDFYTGGGAGDPGDWAGGGGSDPFDAVGTTGVSIPLSSVDKIVIDVLGCSPQ